MSWVKTARYSNPNVATCGLVPVGITAFPPRFRLAYAVRFLADLAPSISMLMQARAGKLSAEEFRRRYRARLDALGVDHVVGLLKAVKSTAPGVVLLCYEDVTAGEVCHRRHLAEWLLERAALHVDELPDPGRKAIGPAIIPSSCPAQ